MTDGLLAPKNKRDFTKEWARRIIVDYILKTDPEWCLASVLKVMDVMVKENPHPGKNYLKSKDKIIQCLHNTNSLNCGLKMTS